MLLAIDTSTQWMGLALYTGEEIVGELAWKTKNHHTVELAPSVASMMDRCGVTPKNLTCLAVATGPGSFTSLRIGIAYVKGLALALHLPVVGIPTLEISARAQTSDDRPLMVCLQAGRERIAYQTFVWQKKKWVAEGEPLLGYASDIVHQITEPTIVCGELTNANRTVLKEKSSIIEVRSPSASLRRPAYLAEIAWKRFLADDVDDAATIAPIYLHVGASIPD